MSNKKGTKRQIIEIEMPGQDNQLGQQESGRALRSATASPVLTRQDRPSSSGLQPSATRSNGTGASATREGGGAAGTGAIATSTIGIMGSAEYAGHATGGTHGTVATDRAADRTSGTKAIASRATDENITSPAASGAVLGRAANGSKTPTGADPDGNDQNRTPSEDSASERDATGQTSSNCGPEAGSSTTIALHRTESRATTPSEASAGDMERYRSEDDDREEPRPDPALDPRWEAALRSRGAAPIDRGDPETGAIATTTDGTIGFAEYASNATGGIHGTGATVRAADRTNGTAEYASNATGGTNGPTRAGTRQVRIRRVRRSRVQDEEAITPEPRSDLEVNGPLYDSNVVDVIPESEDEARARLRPVRR